MKVNIGRPRNEQGYKQQIEVKIHSWDVYDVPHSIALIAYPLVKKLLENGPISVPFKFIDTLPEETSSEDVHIEWKKVLEEIVFCLGEQANYNKNRPTFPRNKQLTRKEEERRKQKAFDIGDWQEACNVTEESHEKWQAYNARLAEGLELFGRYFTSLWA